MKIIKIVISLFLVFTLCFTVVSGKYSIDKVTDKDDYKCILSVWHVDTFQGGSNSRKQFLSNISKDFEKENKGVIVSVNDRKIENIEDDFNRGVFPDLISFGNGLLVEPTVNIKLNDSFFTCTENGKLKSVPWCCGNYFLIKNVDFNYKKRDINSLVVSKSAYNQPLLCFNEIDKTFMKIDVKESDKAFVSFYYGEYEYLLGTQRDIVKLENLNKKYEYECISSFNDLFQYLSITSRQKDKQIYSQKFIEYLLSDKVQKKLSKLNLFSCFIKNEYNIQALNGVKTDSVSSGLFYNLSKTELNEIYNLTVDCFINKTKDKNKLNNLSFLLKKN